MAKGITFRRVLRWLVGLLLLALIILLTLVVIILTAFDGRAGVTLYVLFAVFFLVALYFALRLR
jgi:hypothetical protein